MVGPEMMADFVGDGADKVERTGAGRPRIGFGEPVDEEVLVDVDLDGAVAQLRVRTAEVAEGDRDVGRPGTVQIGDEVELCDGAPSERACSTAIFSFSLVRLPCWDAMASAALNSR
jgi:hypothetical protein